MLYAPQMQYMLHHPIKKTISHPPSQYWINPTQLQPQLPRHPSPITHHCQPKTPTLGCVLVQLRFWAYMYSFNSYDAPMCKSIHPIGIKIKHTTLLEEHEATIFRNTLTLNVHSQTIHTRDINIPCLIFPLQIMDHPNKLNYILMALSGTRLHSWLPYLTTHPHLIIEALLP